MLGVNFQVRSLGACMRQLTPKLPSLTLACLDFVSLTGLEEERLIGWRGETWKKEGQVRRLAAGLRMLKHGAAHTCNACVARACCWLRLQHEDAVKQPAIERSQEGSKQPW